MGVAFTKCKNLNWLYDNWGPNMTSQKENLPVKTGSAASTISNYTRQEIIFWIDTKRPPALCCQLASKQVVNWKAKLENLSNESSVNTAEYILSNRQRGVKRKLTDLFQNGTKKLKVSDIKPVEVHDFAENMFGFDDFFEETEESPKKVMEKRSDIAQIELSGKREFEVFASSLPPQPCSAENNSPEEPPKNISADDQMVQTNQVKSPQKSVCSLKTSAVLKLTPRTRIFKSNIDLDIKLETSLYLPRNHQKSNLKEVSSSSSTSSNNQSSKVCSKKVIKKSCEPSQINSKLDLNRSSRTVPKQFILKNVSSSSSTSSNNQKSKTFSKDITKKRKKNSCDQKVGKVPKTCGLPKPRKKLLENSRINKESSVENKSSKSCMFRSNCDDDIKIVETKSQFCISRRTVSSSSSGSSKAPDHNLFNGYLKSVQSIESMASENYISLSQNTQSSSASKRRKLYNRSPESAKEFNLEVIDI